MDMEVKPIHTIDEIEKELEKEKKNEIEKDLHALGFSIVAYYVEIVGLTKKESDREKWKKVVEKYVEEQTKSDEGITEKNTKKAIKFFEITNNGVEEVKVVELEDKEEPSPIEMSILERSDQPTIEAISSPLIDAENIEQAVEIEKIDKNKAIDILSNESPTHIEEAYKQKEKTVVEIERIEKNLKTLYTIKEEDKELLKSYIKKLPKALSKKYLLLLEKYPLTYLRKMVKRDLEFLYKLKENVKTLTAKEISLNARKLALKLINIFKKLLR